MRKVWQVVLPGRDRDWKPEYKIIGEFPHNKEQDARELSTKTEGSYVRPQRIPIEQ